MERIVEKTNILPTVHLSLKNYFKEKRITNAKVAKELGCNPVFICAILNGKKPIGRIVAKRLSEIYGFNRSWLESGEGNMFTNTEVVNAEDAPMPSLDTLIKQIKLQNVLIECIYKDLDKLTKLLVSEYNKKGLTADIK